MTRSVRNFLMGLGFILAPTPVFAACNVISLCSCTASASGVAFGTYDPFSATPTNSSGSVTVDCTLSIALSGSFDIALSTGSSGTYNARTMTNGGANLSYNLYTSAAQTQVWGDGTGSSATVNQTFSALLTVSKTVQVYGEIPAGQNVPAGVYADTIMVTVTY